MEEEKGKKEISNKKAIIAIIVVIVLLAILGIVYANIFRNKEDNCNNTKEEEYYYEYKDPSGNTVRYPIRITTDKPIIYIYPTEETKVNVKVGRPENLTHTYPKYNDGWEVIAKPSGDLTDTNTGRNLYSLYWEGINTVEPNMNEGFIVKGEDTIAFLEEKLSVLGLNEREVNEFIIYWLPKLESNKYNFIRFQTQEEINSNMPLEITPKPDTVIRIVMEFKGLEEPIEVQEQRLETPERTGYTVVEWGGTEVK